MKIVGKLPIVIDALDENATIYRRKEKSDFRELRRVYREYKDYIIKQSGGYTSEKREKLIRARTIASVLFEVLTTVTSVAGYQAVAEADNLRPESNVQYNILPLGQEGVHDAIMQLPEIKIAVAAVRNVRRLPFLDDLKYQGPFIFDLFDWLQFCFGFQKGNIANQREHLILLLANAHSRQTQKQSPKLVDGALNELMNKFFKNYTDWCKFLDRKSSIRLPYLIQESQQHKILYLSLYLLIWGEAANLRFMPECLCYIFHHMASELHGLLVGAVNMITGENVLPAYGKQPEAFLEHVVSPIYEVIRKEAMKNRNGTADHSTWRNYDDLNEFFWSPDCFEIGWPMRPDHDFFYVNWTDDVNLNKTQTFHDTREEEINEKKEDEEMGGESHASTDEKRKSKWIGKTNFVEIRSFWQIFRSFDRMWTFLILSLQAMIIMACHDLESPLQMFDATILEDVMSIFITSAVLKLVQAILDISFTWKARTSMNLAHRRKDLIKMVVAMIWTIVLPIFYSSSRKKYTCYSMRNGSWLGEWCYSSYMVAVAFYLTSNGINMVLFLVPAVGKYIETSNSRICTVLSMWTQHRLYIGRGMQERQVSLLKYTLFWMLLFLSIFSFSYTFEIKPLISPTRQIMGIGIKNYEWHELFPEVKSNASTIAAIWPPLSLCTSWMHKYGILFIVLFLVESMESCTILAKYALRGCCEVNLTLCLLR